MRVSPNSTLSTLIANLRKHGEEQEGALSQLSSGKRIEKAADDSAGLAHATKLKATVRSQRQATRNANDGISFVQTAEGGLNEISNVLIRLREISVQASTDTVGETERGFLDTEYQSLVEEVDRIANATSFNGTNVINGEGRGVMDFHIGANAGEENVIQFDTDSNYTDTSTLGIDGTGVTDKDGALDNIAYLDDAIERVGGQRAYLGAIQNRLHHASQNLETSTINHEATRAKIEDADIAEVSAKLTLSNLKQTSAMKTLSEGIDFSSAVYRLLG